MDKARLKWGRTRSIFQTVSCWKTPVCYCFSPEPSNCQKSQCALYEDTHREKITRALSRHFPYRQIHFQKPHKLPLTLPKKNRLLSVLWITSLPNEVFKSSFHQDFDTLCKVKDALFLWKIGHCVFSSLCPFLLGLLFPSLQKYYPSSSETNSKKKIFQKNHIFVSATLLLPTHKKDFSLLFFMTKRKPFFTLLWRFSSAPCLFLLNRKMLTI